MVKNHPANAGDAGLIIGLGRSPGEGNGNRLQYSCLGNPMDRGAWWATLHGVAMSQTRLSDLIQVGHSFPSKEKCLLISWLQSASAVILEPPKIKSATVSTVSPSISH